MVDVHAAGVSFPEVLQTRGQYQFKPPLPFVPGSEVGGHRAQRARRRGVRAGDRVAAFCMLGGFAEVAVAPEYLVFALPDELDFAQGAGASPQLPHRLLLAEPARAAGARARPCSSTARRAASAPPRSRWRRGSARGPSPWSPATRRSEVAREAGADEVVRSDGPWKDEVKELSGGGVDVVLDPVGGDRFTDSLRSLREGGRLVVVGFTGGSIPEVKVNRLLLNNTEVVGAGWGAYVMGKPELNREIGAAIDGLIAERRGAPVVGARYPLERAADALKLIDGGARRARSCSTSSAPDAPSSRTQVGHRH